MMTETMKSLELIKALADPVRIEMFYILAKKEMCVCELSDIFRMSQPRISRHLGILKKADLITVCKRSDKGKESPSGCEKTT